MPDLLNVSIEGQKATYSAGTNFTLLASANNPNSVCGLQGSPTKRIRVSRIAITGLIATSSLMIDCLVTKRSGGTQSPFSTIVSAGPFDARDPAATATCGYWTTNVASFATSVATIYATKVFLQLTTSAQLPDRLTLDFGNRPSRMPVLNGTTDWITIDWANVGSNQPYATFSFEWTEE